MLHVSKENIAYESNLFALPEPAAKKIVQRAIKSCLSKKPAARRRGTVALPSPPTATALQMSLRQVFEKSANAMTGSPAIPRFLWETFEFLVHGALQNPEMWSVDTKSMVAGPLQSVLRDPTRFSLDLFRSAVSPAQEAISFVKAFIQNLTDPLLSDIAINSLLSIEGIDEAALTSPSTTVSPSLTTFSLATSGSAISSSSSSSSASSIGLAEAMKQVLQKLPLPNRSLLQYFTFYLYLLVLNHPVEAKQQLSVLMLLLTGKPLPAANGEKLRKNILWLVLHHEHVFRDREKSQAAVRNWNELVGDLRGFVRELGRTHSVCNTMAELSVNTPGGSVVAPMVDLLVTSGDFWQWFRLTARQIVDDCLQSTTLFRSSNTKTQMIKYFFLKYCAIEDLMRDIFVKHLNEITACPPSTFQQFEHDQDLSVLASQHRLTSTWVNKLIQTIVAIPPTRVHCYGRWAFSVLSEEASRKFPASKYSIISSWLLLRLSIPTILTPSEPYTVYPPLPDAYRNFVSALLKQVMRIADSPADDTGSSTTANPHKDLIHGWFSSLLLPNTKEPPKPEAGMVVVHPVAASTVALAATEMSQASLPEPMRSVLPTEHSRLKSALALANGEELVRFRVKRLVGCEVTGLVYDSARDRLLTLNSQGELGIFELPLLQQKALVPTHNKTCHSFILGASLDQVLLTSDAGLQAWDLEAKASIAPLSVLPVLAALLLGKTEVWCASPCSLEVWDPFTFQQIHIIDTRGANFCSLASVNNQLIWAGSSTGDLAIFNATTRATLHTIPRTHVGAVHLLAVNPNNQHVWTACQGSTDIKIFHGTEFHHVWTVSPSQLSPIVGIHIDPLFPLAWVCTAGGLITLYDTNTFGVLEHFALPAPQYQISSLAAVYNPALHQHDVCLGTLGGALLLLSFSLNPNYTSLVPGDAADPKDDRSRLKRNLSNISRKMLVRPPSHMALP